MPDQTTVDEPFPDVDRGDPDRQLDPERPIFRYMRLPAFLMLLTGEAFIPTLATLRKSDPLESRLPLLCYPCFASHFSPFWEDGAAEWLFEKMPKWKAEYVQVNQKAHSNSAGRYYINTWLDELANRRCIWCWYASSQQSMAQWKVYASYGVAIQSSLARIRSALEQTLPSTKTSAGLVHYEEALRFNANDDFVDPRWLVRPYYFKEMAYKYEEEVRLAMAVNPGLCDLSPGGIRLNIDPAKLIAEVIISPEIYGSEAVALKSTLTKEFSFLKDADINISLLLSKDLQPDDSAASVISRQLDTPFALLDLDFDQDGKPSPLPSSLFGEV
jgi:hypothetical protein